MDRFTLSANTLSKTVKDNLADRIEVEIGDSKQLDFKPQFKIKRWDNEVNFSMRAQEEAGANMVEEDGKVKYKGRDIEVHQYEKPDASEDGGFEFEWVLKNKPTSNILQATIQHKGLDFFYQPALTAEEIEQGASRDENVVGSYAVYHSTKRDNIVGGMEYKSGKAFHIYRPHAIDADGVKVWCELDITEGELKVTVPEDFLNKASYPVVVDPTFGFTSVGSTSVATLGGVDGDTSLVTSSTLTEAGDVTSLSIYGRSANFFGNYPKDVKGLIYSNNAGEPNARQGITTITNFSSATPQWWTLTFSTAVPLTAADYWIGGTGAEDAAGVPVFYDTTGGHARSDVPFSTYASPAATWDTAGDVALTQQYSIYATYTASFNPAFAHRRLLL